MQNLPYPNNNNNNIFYKSPGKYFLIKVNNFITNLNINLFFEFKKKFKIHNWYIILKEKVLFLYEWWITVITIIILIWIKMILKRCFEKIIQISNYSWMLMTTIQN